MNKSIRNISTFVIISLASGWLGLLVDKLTKSQTNEESLGMAIWLVLPLLATIFLRFFAGDGWKDIGIKFNFKGNIKWYFIALIIYPSVTAAILAIGKIFGWISFSNFRTEVYLTGVVALLLPNLIKNFFEESVWRGYLTAKLLHTKIKDIWLYVIVGVVWGAWHLPYYLFFLPEADISLVLPVGRFEIALISIIAMTCWSVMFVEIYRLTKSIWSVVLLHAIEDSVINHLVIDGHITIVAGKEMLVSPIAGVITTLFYLSIGLLLQQKRISKEKSNNKKADI